MKNKVLDSWLNIWLYGLAVIGIVLLTILIAKWVDFDWTVRLSMLAIIVIPIHVWEEERIPGGFTYMFNTLQNLPNPDRYPMNEFIAMSVDYATVLVFIAILIFSNGSTWFGIAIALFCCLETAIHTATGILNLTKYRAKGKRTTYVPGAASAYVGFLPIAIGLFYHLLSNGLGSWKDWMIGVAVAVAVLATTVKGLERILKDENSPYVALEKYRIGYFKKFMITPSDMV